GISPSMLFGLDQAQIAEIFARGGLNPLEEVELTAIQKAERGELMNPLVEGDVFSRATSSIDAWFTGPNGEQFQLTTIRDENGDAIGQQYINANGEVVSQSVVDQILSFFANMNPNDADE